MNNEAKRVEDFPGQDELKYVFGQIETVAKNMEDLTVERLKAQETVVATTSATADSFNVLLQNAGKLANMLQKALTQNQEFASEISKLANEINNLTKQLNQMKDEKAAMLGEIKGLKLRIKDLQDLSADRPESKIAVDESTTNLSDNNE